MRFLPYSPAQAYLVPPTVREVLGEGHLCFFLRRVVERLDLRALEQVYEEEGRPGYHPALLVWVWLYAYALGVTSSRRLEQRIREDLAFRYLAGGAQPDFWTLNAFRRRHPKALNDLFTQVVELARGAAAGSGASPDAPQAARSGGPGDLPAAQGHARTGAGRAERTTRDATLPLARLAPGGDRIGAGLHRLQPHPPVAHASRLGWQALASNRREAARNDLAINRGA
jgi:transposase